MGLRLTDTSEVLTRRIGHFTRGVIFGSRALIDQWFESHRHFVQGRSRRGRKRGAKSLGQPALRGLYALRNANYITATCGRDSGT